jgi:hypothetical protein
VDEDEAYFWLMGGPPGANCAKVGGELLYRLAEIPPPCREQFLQDVGDDLRMAFTLNSLRLPAEAMNAVEEIEKNVRAAYSRLLALPADLQKCFFLFPAPDSELHRLVFGDETNPPSDDAVHLPLFEGAFKAMLALCSLYTKGHPEVAAKSGGPGRRKKHRTRATNTLRSLIWNIARVVKRHHGKLTLDRAKQKGTWIAAMDGLRPLFPQGFIPKAPPLSMIEELQAKSNKTPLAS